MLTLKWVKTGNANSNLYVGKEEIYCGYVCKSLNAFECVMLLPGFDDTSRMTVENYEQAKAEVENMVKHWFFITTDGSVS